MSPETAAKEGHFDFERPSCFDLSMMDAGS